ncbi:efflux RND transporter periplasmic adaptor subunit [Hyphomicrobium sp.]|jgi:multidrug efflux system membrane fusion protein|uniref:efflux RND transporter periplasmic adaptor subunit n=1 Tax=Hyphomicrobium sp. TaxID=82 RepID=UPI002C91C99C|nr:efflux RND transporter periplasmic adaptor subunit [Hyphomicrobium sp.]HVZ05635.1 efflux RND transporter periplasmic adaptor subunit [Hyphomicrobium sp.]
MRIRKFALAALVLIAGSAVTFDFWPQISSKLETAEKELAQKPSAPAAAPPFAMPVPVTHIVKKTVPVYLEYSARTESIRNITLQARVSGYVEEQHVPDGADVAAGTLLYTIDPRDYQAALDQAKAQKLRDEAARDYAKSNLNRGTALAKDGWLAKDTFDQRTSALHQAEASLILDDALIRTAELNLGYTRIVAPFAGRLGKNLAPVGTLISVAGAPLNTLVQLDPIYVTFNPSETNLASIEKVRLSGSVAAEVFVPGEMQARYKGKVTFVDNAVDQQTGTVVARATIGNKDFSLLPGQYVRVKLKVGEEADALMVPRTALGSSQLGKYLYIVDKDNKAEQRLVTTGPIDGDLVSVVGPNESDLVITGNLQKIAPGVPVQPLPPSPVASEASGAKQAAEF